MMDELLMPGRELVNPGAYGAREEENDTHIYVYMYIICISIRMHIHLGVRVVHLSCAASVDGV